MNAVQENSPSRKPRIYKDNCFFCFHLSYSSNTVTVLPRISSSFHRIIRRPLYSQIFNMFFFSAFAAILFLFGSSQKFFCANGLAIPNPRYPLSTEATIGSGNIMERQLYNNDQDGDIAAIAPRAPIVPASTLAQPARKPYKDEGEPGSGQQDEGEPDEQVHPPPNEIEHEIDTPGPPHHHFNPPHHHVDHPGAPDKCKGKPHTEEEEIRCKKQSSPPSA